MTQWRFTSWMFMFCKPEPHKTSIDNFTTTQSYNLHDGPTGNTFFIVSIECVPKRGYWREIPLKTRHLATSR